MDKLKKTVLDIVEIVVIAFAISFVLTKFLFMPVEVDGHSMMPTLNDHDRGFSSIISKSFGLDRFDIVVLDTEDHLIVKRIIGMPNEKVEYIDDVLYINGEEIPDTNANGHTSDFSIQLNDDEYFCLGDNREVSKDSRYYGPFTIDKIISKHVFVVYPFSNFGHHE